MSLALPTYGRTSPETAIDLLNEVRSGLLDGDLGDSFWKLVCGLRSIREAAAREEWATLISECLAHPVRELVHQEPYTKWGFDRPRGYAGDARLIDYLYCRGPAPGQSVTKLGHLLHQHAIRTPGGYSVRQRCDVAARMIDAIAIRRHNPAVLSVACGHLREASRTARLRDVGRFLAIDQDPQSVRVVSDEWADAGVEARCMHVTDLLRGSESAGSFDLIYALGLYDYLSAATARALTLQMFKMLSVGGTLLVANFTPSTIESGFMEAFMRWSLIYRTLNELEALCEPLPAAQVGEVKVWADDANTIAYLAAQRA